jgi:hypothetical protein
VLLDPGGDGEDVRVEDHVLRGEPGDVDEQAVGAGQDVELAIGGVGLALLVEGHDDRGRAIATDQAGMLEEGLLALLERDRVDDTLALDALEPGLDHLPLRGVDHHRHAGDVRLTGDQVEEPGHGRGRVEHRLVHVDVDDLGAGVHLFPGDLDRRVEVAVEDELGELARPGDVGALADVDEDVAGLRDRHCLEPRQAGHGLDLRRDPRRDALDGFGDRPDVGGRRAAAAAGDVDQPLPGEAAHEGGHLLGCLVVPPELVGEAGVRVGADGQAREPAQVLDVLAKLLGAERAVEAHHDGPRVGHRVPERADRLAGQGPPGGVGDRSGDDQRAALAQRLEGLLDADDRGLRVERVEDRLDQEQVHAAGHQALGRLAVGGHELLEGDVASTRVVDVGRDRRAPVGGPQGAGDEPRPVGLA